MDEGEDKAASTFADYRGTVLYIQYLRAGWVLSAGVAGRALSAGRGRADSSAGLLAVRRIGTQYACCEVLRLTNLKLGLFPAGPIRRDFVRAE